MIVAAFLFFLALFAGVGIASHVRARADQRDYWLASQETAPWLAGLSAVATNNSGYMFIGIIGYTYAVGLPSIWLMIGWITGDFVASGLIHQRLRVATTATRSETFAAILGRWGGTEYTSYRRLAGAISVVFLGVYAAAQLTAGSKALHVLFGWPEPAGAILGAAIVVAYCWAGGIRASIWTDAAQSIVMLVAMAVLFVAAVASLGGASGAWSALDAVSPAYMDPMPSGLGFGGAGGAVLFIVGWVFAGFSVAGQPHIMVRFMSLDRPEHTNRARAWYYLWFVAFYFLANGVGLLSRVVLQRDVAFDAELALPMMALELLPAPLVGLMLAGVFAAAMSTADSLILSCAASATGDFLPRRKIPMAQVKGATLAVTAFALGVALFGDRNVFSLVVGAWAVMAGAFAPLLTVYALGGRPTERLALAMTIGGVASVYAWRSVDALGDYYEGMLAIVVGFAIYALGRGRTQEARGTTAAPADPG